MSTEVIKLNSLKSNVQSIFNSIVSKFRSPHNYDITLVIQQNAESEKMSTHEMDKLSNTEIEESQKSKKSVNFNENLVVNNIEGGEEDNLNMSDCIFRPNFQSEQKLPLKEDKGRMKNKANAKANKQNQRQFQQLKVNSFVQTDAAPQMTNPKPLKTQFKLQDSINDEIANKDYLFKINNIELHSAHSSDSSSEDNDSNAGFLIEKHLNQALSLVELNKIDDLEDFLYNYKEKYSFINARTQTKWSLLMAHCKESKREYERAATNYSQVIEQLKEYPHIIVTDQGAIFNKLGRCFYESRMWNKAISAYSEALNQFKQSKKVQEYSNTLVNLGILYLEVNYFVEAEKCFLMAYDIRRHEGDTNSMVNLLPLLLHLVDSNLNLKNYNQAKQILQLMHEIFSDTKDPVDPLLKIGYHIKQAKLFFFLGQLELTSKECHEANQLLTQKKYESFQYGQLLEIMGLLKQEKGEYFKSKEYFERALKAIQKYLSIDNIKIQILKKRISNLSKFTNQKSNRLLMRQISMDEESEDSEEINSECFDPL